MESITKKKVVENSIIFTVELQCSCTPCQGCNRKASKKAKFERKVVESHIISVQMK